MICRIVAIVHVHLPLQDGADLQALRTFYGEILGLEEVTDDLPAGVVLAFRSRMLQLRLCSGRAGRIRRMYRGCVLVVESLEQMSQALHDADIEHRWEHGWGYYGRRIFLRDPAGNLIELKEAPQPL